MSNIYDQTYLKSLFDEMQSSYERVCNMTSFGFNRRWRRLLIGLMGIETGMQAGDLMAGSGESWIYLLPRIAHDGHLTAIDFSHESIKQAHKRRAKLGAQNITILEEDALCSSIPSNSLDAVICVYGVKTLSPLGQRQFVQEVKRILKPGGRLGLVEVSVPQFAPMRWLYGLHLGVIVPIVGKLLLGNPHNYRMLWRYTSAFGNCRGLECLFAESGFDLRFISLFGGCATALVGRKSVSRRQHIAAEFVKRL